MKIIAWMRLGIAAVMILFGICVFVAWRGVRNEQAQLHEELKSAEQTLTAATARQENRRVALEQQLEAIQKEKASVTQPEEVVKALPQVLPLPQALEMQSSPVSIDNAGASLQVPGSAKAQPTGEPQVQIPAEDLKPLYDFALECKACQAKLAAAQADLKDEKTKTQALGRERDDALRAARGGSALRRVVRAAKWFVIGAAAGALAAKATR